MRWTPEDLAAYQARMASKRAEVYSGCVKKPNVDDTPEHEDAAESQPEYKLQARVENELKRRGWYFFHDRSRKENIPGFLDLVIAAPAGRTIWLELKTKGGKLTDDQKRTKARLMYLGHEVHEVRSFKQFLALVEG